MKIAKSLYDRICNLLCLLILVAVGIYLLISWQSIPQQIPGHYNAVGQIDKYTSKTMLLVLAFIDLLMYGFLTVIEHLPGIWNTGINVTENNKKRVYRITKNLLMTMKLLLVIVFSALVIVSSLGQSLPVFFVPAFMVVMFGVIIFFGIQLVRCK